MSSTNCDSILDSSTPDLTFEWIHCNICFVELNDHSKIEIKYETGLSGYSFFQLFLHPKSVDSLKYSLLTCGHIFCNNCFSSNGNLNNQCPICIKSVAFYELVGELPNELVQYFKPVSQLFLSTHESIKLQNENMKNLLTHYKHKIDRQKDILLKAKRELLNLKAIKEELKQLRDEKNRNEHIKKSQLERECNPINVQLPFPQKQHTSAPNNHLIRSPSISTLTSPIQTHPASFDDLNMLSSTIYNQEMPITPIYTPKSAYRRSSFLKNPPPSKADPYNIPMTLSSLRQSPHSPITSIPCNKAETSTNDHLRLFSYPSHSFRNQFEPFKYPRQMSNQLHQNFVQTQNPPVPLFSSNSECDNFQSTGHHGTFPSYKNIRQR